MAGAFTWISEVIHFLGSLIPRIVIVRATHSGVKWVYGSRVEEMRPGLHVYWPFVTEIELVVAARQTTELPTQVLCTRDGKQYAVGLFVVHRIVDVIAAVGGINWDYDHTIADITRGASVRVISSSTAEELSDPMEMEKRLTAECRQALEEFGVDVERVAFGDLTPCRVYRMIGDRG